MCCFSVDFKFREERGNLINIYQVAFYLTHKEENTSPF